MNEKALLRREEIERIIPHRTPMLLVDEVLEIEYGDSIVAKFYISEDMDIFRGHFPDNPVFPGVYTIECMAQTSCILILSLEEYHGKLPLFLGVEKVSFKKMIKPGDELIIKSGIKKHNAEKAVISFASEVFVETELAAIGEVVLALR